jgi:hypothetical protein
MLMHVVLFTPRSNLTLAERRELVASFVRALRDIPSIRRSRIGRRITHGRAYEQSMAESYDYAAILEFDDVDGLKTYLDHSAHGDLAQRFFTSLESVLVYDYEMSDSPDGLVKS